MNETEALDLYEQVLDSGVLGKSQRQAKLLKYLMMNSVEGNSERVNETTIAIDIFGKDASFDISSSSIVRVEMHRLRKNLDLFNAQSDVQIELPRASYVLLVSTKEAQPKPDTQAEAAPPNSVTLILIVSASFLCLLVAFTWYKSEQRKLAPLEEGYRPIVQIFVDTFDRSFESEIDAAIIQALNSDNGLHVSRVEGADYKMLVKEGNQLLLMELWSSQGQLVHSLSVDLDKLNRQQIIARVRWLIRYEFLQDMKSKMIIDYASAEWVDPRKREIHRCVTDTQSLSSGVELSYYTPKELPICLGNAATNNVQDKARISLDLALLAMQQARGYYELGIDKPLELARQRTDLAAAILGNDRQVFVNRIYSYWVGGVVPGETMAVLKAAKNAYPEDEVLAYMRSVTSALYMNDWDEVDPNLHVLITLLKDSDEINPLAALPLAQSILASNESDARVWLTKLNSANPPFVLWGIAVACKFNIQTLITTQQSHLKKEGISSFSSTTDAINQLKYSPELTTALTEPLNKCAEMTDNEW